jgi:hypothetical protein
MLQARGGPPRCDKLTSCRVNQPRPTSPPLQGPGKRKVSPSESRTPSEVLEGLSQEAPVCSERVIKREFLPCTLQLLHVADSPTPSTRVGAAQNTHCFAAVQLGTMVDNRWIKHPILSLCHRVARQVRGAKHHHIAQVMTDLGARGIHKPNVQIHVLRFDACTRPRRAHR